MLSNWTIVLQNRHVHPFFMWRKSPCIRLPSKSLTRHDESQCLSANASHPILKILKWLCFITSQTHQGWKCGLAFHSNHSWGQDIPKVFLQNLMVCAHCTNIGKALTGLQPVQVMFTIALVPRLEEMWSTLLKTSSFLCVIVNVPVPMGTIFELSSGFFNK